jgi:hypothetical protein
MEGRAVELRQLLTAAGYRVYAKHTDVPTTSPNRRGIASDELVNFAEFMSALVDTYPAVPHDALHCVVDVLQDATFVQLTVYE